jgi:hypothetical protein
MERRYACRPCGSTGRCGAPAAHPRRRVQIDLRAALGAGITCRGVVGDADPVAAVQDIWDAERFDEVIVATLPHHVSRWLRLDLPRRVEELTGRPTSHVIASERSAIAH